MCKCVAGGKDMKIFWDLQENGRKSFSLGAQRALKKDKVRGEKEQRAEEKCIFATDN